MRRLAQIIALVLFGLVLAGATAWGVLALHIAGPGAAPVRTALAAVFATMGLVTLGTLGTQRWRRRSLAVFAVLFLGVLGWWGTLTPSNDRDWQAEVAVLPYAEFDGNRVTVRNIRHFDYRSETDFTPGYYDRTFDVETLESVDIVAAYWMGPHIAHTFLSFGFQGGEQLAVSVETRKEEGEAYSTVNGFFRQYELHYVVADERDVIRVRTNYRRQPTEDVYVYRVNVPIENVRRVFLDYLHKINALRDRPEFYNTLTTNCTSNIWLHTRVNPGHLPFSWKILLSGHVPEFLYESGRLDTHLPFAELQHRSHVNARAQAADQAPDFPWRIRRMEAGAL